MCKFLEMDKITKIYPGGVVANYEVDFSVQEGEIHALIGENGAGKSTLMKILFGMEKQTEGKVFLKGKELNMNSSLDALSNGIGMVHQHFMLVPSLSVAENIVLGSEIKKGVFLDKSKAIEHVRQLSEKYNLPVNPKSKIMDISVSNKQKVEILKALYRGAKILILDEPTAVLTPQEIEELFEQLKLLKESGHTIIFISHKLHEIKKLCDRLTIMRDGRSMGVYKVDEVSEDDISRLMVGRDVKLDIEKKEPKAEEVLLNVKDVSYVDEFGKGAVKDVSFSVRRGEIVGIAGVEGNGQSEIIEVITGLKRANKGDVFLKNKNIGKMNIKEIRNLGMSHIPEDRMHTGIAPNMSVEENFISEKYSSEELTKRGFWLNKNKINNLSRSLIKDFNVKTDSEKSPIKGLSGGNIQKVVVGREFSSDSDLLIVNQPTRGIDVGAIEFIRKKIVAMRDRGKGILLVSADLNEVMTLSDSLIVMNEGEIAGYFPNSKDVTEEELGLYMLGVKRQEKEEIRRATNE
ncbi:MAG: ABC transporter ATP-binding protein [Anaeromicrobium sp.]|jgi:simple sugar transport system ATP-binding protein|uniref:ABC transporter ATP-binding protein n=1 Tax=Anaeromicrobium sp. TaxID=1929132 RepID=UPI0025E750D1|nr:ABC transporter ATP-binding protein [Anaeromicrobium sp.]MCT4595260.1 ABC transporter ATP-binding protein [Anaeromicrobium sp.]